MGAPELHPLGGAKAQAKSQSGPTSSHACWALARRRDQRCPPTARLPNPPCTSPSPIGSRFCSDDQLRLADDSARRNVLKNLPALRRVCLFADSGSSEVLCRCDRLPVSIILLLTVTVASVASGKQMSELGRLRDELARIDKQRNMSPLFGAPPFFLGTLLATPIILFFVVAPLAPQIQIVQLRKGLGFYIYWLLYLAFCFFLMRKSLSPEYSSKRKDSVALNRRAEALKDQIRSLEGKPAGGVLHSRRASILIAPVLWFCVAALLGFMIATLLVAVHDPDLVLCEPPEGEGPGVLDCSGFLGAAAAATLPLAFSIWPLVIIGARIGLRWDRRMGKRVEEWALPSLAFTGFVIASINLGLLAFGRKPAPTEPVSHLAVWCDLATVLSPSGHVPVVEWICAAVGAFLGCVAVLLWKR